MTAVGEQQESLLLRELETDITMSRCMQIMTYLEQNLNLVRNEDISHFQRFNLEPRESEEKKDTAQVGDLQGNMDVVNID